MSYHKSNSLSFAMKIFSIRSVPGIATVIFAFGVGPSVSLGLYSISAIAKR